LLSVGYLSGYSQHSDPPDYPQETKHYVVNGAFNPGNSGGPVFSEGDEKVIGVVVSKLAPLSKFVASALTALANNASGIVFSRWDEKGNQKSLVESQVVA
jgi:S1-C subfamily serine protease